MTVASKFLRFIHAGTASPPSPAEASTRPWRRAAAAPLRAVLHLPPTRLLVALTVVLLASSWGVAAYFAFRSHRSVIESSTEVLGSLKIEEQVQGILALLDRADGAGQAFLLTGRTQYRSAFEEAAGKVPGELRRLAVLTGDDSSHRQEMEWLRLLVRERLDLIVRQIGKHAGASDRSAFTVAMNERGIQLADAVRASAWRIIEAEQRRLIARQHDLAARAAFDSAWLKLFFGINTVFAAAALLLAARMIRLQRFAKVCAWSRTIEYEGAWVTFEEYLERRFKIRTSHGISPAEAAKLIAQSPETLAPSGEGA